VARRGWAAGPHCCPWKTLLCQDPEPLSTTQLRDDGEGKSVLGFAIVGWEGLVGEGGPAAAGCRSFSKASKFGRLHAEFNSK
jgi:hypothetical protein